ncbi:unnamed protein product [Oppiella nova]|uniref:Cytochrome P450 n=1 Tax=Oppiella nova TaxID=334625 RepID=A0A7R9LAR7_9ACAR|nr:unnamed protein product [Oppiella nova]CAG2161676.1 unnamed protein product [Oppiella nova]
MGNKSNKVSEEGHRNKEDKSLYLSSDKFEFYPERFMPENRDQLVPYTYLPFGLGPRNCVGMRFSLMEVKTAVAHLVNKFIFVKTPATKPLTNDMMKKLHLIVNYGDLKVGIELRTPTFMGREPALTVADPELVKDIMIKDFNVFINRRDMGSMDEILDHALTVVKDDDWKRLRSILEKAAKDEKEIEMKELMGNYTMDD